MEIPKLESVLKGAPRTIDTTTSQTNVKKDVRCRFYSSHRTGKSLIQFFNECGHKYL